MKLENRQQNGKTRVQDDHRDFTVSKLHLHDNTADSMSHLEFK